MNKTYSFMDYFLVAFLQMCLSVFKVYEVKWSYEDEATKLTIISFLMSGIWIITTAIGVGAVIEGDILMMVIYVLFGGLGKIIAIKFFGQNRYRNKIFKYLKNEKN